MFEGLLIIVRHADYGGGDESPLSTTGVIQANQVGEQIRDFLQQNQGTYDASTVLRIGCTDLRRVIDSLRRMSPRGHMVLLSHFLPEREDTTEEELRVVLDDIVGYAGHRNAGVVVAVGHGDMPAMLTELIARNQFDLPDFPQLPGTGTACGYLLDLKRRQIWFVNAYGISPVDDRGKFEEAKSAEPEQSNPPPFELPGREESAGVEWEPGNLTIFHEDNHSPDVFDDEIPF